MPFALLLLLIALTFCCGFNLDSEQPRIFQMDTAGFGQSVVQFEGSRLVVGAPLEKGSINQTGLLYDCEYSTGRCQPVLLQIPSDAVNMSLGLTLSVTTSPSQLMACGPTVHQLCGEVFYLNGVCFLLNSTLREVRKVPASLRECPKQEIDIAFLIDGSGSIGSDDFQRMKDFVRTVMGQFTGTNTLFSLMQYSHWIRIHFTFNGFKKNPNPEMLVNSISQLGGWTFTATAILQVVQDMFQSSNGARKDATKILIVITDGMKQGDRLEYQDVIPLAEKAGIIRYAIGVGSAFNTHSYLEELRTIASDPPQDHVFQVNNFEALRNIQSQLQEKIFAIEGTQSEKSSFFEHEMSQEGFSAVFTQEGPVLGAVGSFGWSGGFFSYPASEVPAFIKTQKSDMDMNAAYLGYSMEMAFQKGVQKLILGAPRYQHTGMVVIFTQVSRSWEQTAEVKGKQIGSYFGATLCPVDVNRDQTTDLILIGAPHYYEENRGGQVHICALPQNRAQWRCEAIVWGQQGHPLGRFGAALAVLGDINGDKRTDVAVGAPGEEENHGAIYLFHGVVGSSISRSYSQRIIGSQLSPRIQYFGQSLSGGQDLTRDGLADVAVGAQGQVLLLRTRPVLRVGISMNFQPLEVARSLFDCQEQEATSREAGNAKVCFTIQKSSPDHLGEVKSSLKFDLALDPGRLTPRAVFEESKNRTLHRVQILGLGKHCQSVKLLLPSCVVDSLTAIILRLNFSLEGKPIPAYENLRPVLDIASQTVFTASFPFEKNCGKDSICQDDLRITFSFLSLQTLVVGSSLEMNVAVRVQNEGEDSYRTVVTFSYPAGLSYRRISQIQNQPHRSLPPVTCESAIAEAENLRSSHCTVSHPIFRERSEINFNITFDVSPMASLGNKLLFKANVTSENNTPKTSKAVFQSELPVKYAVYMVIISHEESTKYLNFSHSEEKSSYVVKHKYQVNNLGQRNLPIKINFWVPVKLNNINIWDKLELLSSQNFSCTEKSASGNADFVTKLQKVPRLNCSIALCQGFHCDIPSFNIQEELNFTITGNLSLGWFQQTEYNNLLVTSLAEITFNDSKYALLPGQEMFMRAQTETKVERYEVHSPIPLIVGSSIGGLLLLALITAGLYKLGFFKRQYKEMMNNSQEAALDMPLPE
ncbi:integrin alpha-D-like [Dromiciops gliroides]|uniref:integrin alpha-D-like n=1 Tax=Dromiciops gliroides TaxID=33562 RepID=UPI001CC5AFEB|nr:integrin alpha-D-like [Dromiciops gliroides]